MRCSQCEKFVSYDTDVEPEEESSPEVSDTTFTATFRRVLQCAECGTDLKEASIEVEYDFEKEIERPKGAVDAAAETTACTCGHAHEEHGHDAEHPGSTACGEDACDCVAYEADKDADKAHTHEFEIDNCDVSATTESVTKDRNGRPIRSSRYMKTLYGVECTVEVSCECGATASFTASASEQASSFNEC